MRQKLQQNQRENVTCAKKAHVCEHLIDNVKQSTHRYLKATLTSDAASVCQTWYDRCALDAP
jgi:hypothetical protein